MSEITIPAFALDVHEPARQRKLVRDRVLALPELAKKLTLSPLDYAQPEQWNGFIPPEVWDGQVNDSPRRAALLAIVAELEQAEAARAREAIRKEDT